MAGGGQHPRQLPAQAPNNETGNFGTAKGQLKDDLRMLKKRVSQGRARQSRSHKEGNQTRGRIGD